MTAATQDVPSTTSSQETATTVSVPIFDLVVARVRLRVQRRKRWLEHALAQPPIQAVPSERAGTTALLFDHDDPEAEQRWYATDAEAAIQTQRIEEIEQALSDDDGSRLSALVDLFSLAPHDFDLLHACLALRAEPALGKELATLHGDSACPYVSEALVGRLFGHGRTGVYSGASPLHYWRIVRVAPGDPGAPAALELDPAMYGWLDGWPAPDRELQGRIRPLEPKPPLSRWPVAEAKTTLLRALADGVSTRLVVSGPVGTGRRTFAAAVAHALGLTAVAVEPSADLDETAWRDLYVRAQRRAALDDWVLVWRGDAVERAWPTDLPRTALHVVVCESHESPHPVAGLLDTRIELRGPTADEREALWNDHVRAAAAWAPDELRDLADRHRVTVGQIVTAGRTGVVTPRDAAEVCQATHRGQLGDLAQHLPCSFDWDDLVVPEPVETTLRDFAFEAADRVAFWDDARARRLFPRGTGLVGLFTGPPGTGKTMAAQVIAAELRLDLYRIDLAQVTSKYIGETSKNLRRVFSRARHMNAVLLFDEADALFTKRTDVRDAHDRYANADVNYLLQLVEGYDGVAILASNKRGNLDSAFVRRLRYILEFPRPDAPQRSSIWTKVLTGLSGEATAERLGDAVARIAKEVEISGAQIKNAALSAAFAARRERTELDGTHLLVGVRRELAKAGRAIPDDQQRRLLHG